MGEVGEPRSGSTGGGFTCPISAVSRLAPSLPSPTLRAGEEVGCHATGAHRTSSMWAALLGGVGQLAKRIRELEPGDVELKTLGDARIARARPRQRRHADRIVVED